MWHSQIRRASRNATAVFKIAIYLSGAAFGCLGKSDEPRREIGRTDAGAHFLSISKGSTWGLAVEGAGTASAVQAMPAGIEFYEDGRVTDKSSGYDELKVYTGRAEGTAHLTGPKGSRFTFEDLWMVRGQAILLIRKVSVGGTTADSGFLTSITFSHPEPKERSQVDYFAPGMIYGSPDHLSPDSIGAAGIYGSLGGQGEVQIREDRLPAPIFGVHFSDGSALTISDSAPQEETTTADSHDTKIETQMDQRFRFGAIGAHLAGGHHEQGFWFPGAEGEVTYRGNTYPGGQVHAWRRRFHPIRDGFVQQYRLQFRFSVGENFTTYYRNAWRWAYQQLNPPIMLQNLAAMRRSIVDVLASQVQTNGGRAGIPNFTGAVTDSRLGADPKAIMGFTGKNLESAEFLLADSQIDEDPNRAARNRTLGLAIFSSFLRLRMNPPVGEGFLLATGAPALAIPRDHRVYLRSFGDSMKSALRAYHRERSHGELHPEWLTWARQFGDWLLTQQFATGGFPRSWRPGTGEVVDASPQSSYNPVPFLVLLNRETGDNRYLDAAKRAADFVWMHGQDAGNFVGGTIDNPDVLDKEAGTLSKEAYLALFEATHEPKWLQRACAAADFAETWIYLWNVPMPADENDSALQWKRNVPTYGAQLIATGHSLVDEYMAFDVDEYARLARFSGDSHYLDIARLLLHDTKVMTATPGRTYDLKESGWQQEHWSFAPVRGYGLHRGWLPWVATSQLKGIFGLMEFDPSLYGQLAAENAKIGSKKPVQ